MDMGLILQDVLNPPEVTLEVPAAGKDDREGELRQLFAQIEPCRLDGLSRVWDLCAEDLYGLAVWKTGSKDDARDVVQEVFVRLAGAGRRLRRVRRPLAYLLRMAHSAAIDTLRRRRRGESLTGAERLPLLDADPERAAEATRLSERLARLPDPQREAVFLRHFAGLSFRAIGTVTGVPTFTAASRYRLAIRRLRKLMGVEP